MVFSMNGSEEGLEAGGLGAECDGLAFDFGDGAVGEAEEFDVTHEVKLAERVRTLGNRLPIGWGSTMVCAGLLLLKVVSMTSRRESLR